MKDRNVFVLRIKFFRIKDFSCLFVCSFVCYQLFLGLAHQFFLIFCTMMQNGNARNVKEPEFRKKIFRLEMPEICRKKPFFGIFLRFYHQFFLIFCTKMRISNARNMAESDFGEKFFSSRKCWKYARNRRFCRFCSDFFLIFCCFSTQIHY